MLRHVRWLVLVVSSCLWARAGYAELPMPRTNTVAPAVATMPTTGTTPKFTPVAPVDPNKKLCDEFRNYVEQAIADPDDSSATPMASSQVLMACGVCMTGLSPELEDAAHSVCEVALEDDMDNDVETLGNGKSLSTNINGF